MEAVDQRLVDQRLVDLDGTPGQVAAGRQRAAGRVAGGGEGGGGVVRAGALPLRRRPERARAPGADDEHHQRRRARRHLGRRAGVHDRSGGRRLVQGGAALGRRGLPRAQVGAEGQEARHRARRRGRLRPRPARAPAPRWTSSRRPWRRPATRWAATSRWRSTSPPPSSTPTAATPTRARSSRRPSSSAVYEELVDAYPLISIEDPLAEDDWDGWVALTERDRRRRCRSWATTCSSPTPSGSTTASPAAPPTRSW